MEPVTPTSLYKEYDLWRHLVRTYSGFKTAEALRNIELARRHLTTELIGPEVRCKLPVSVGDLADKRDVPHPSNLWVPSIDMLNANHGP